MIVGDEREKELWRAAPSREAIHLKDAMFPDHPHHVSLGNLPLTG